MHTGPAFRAEQLSGDDTYHIRQGDYRIVSEIVAAALIVTVVRVDNRAEADRRKTLRALVDGHTNGHTNGRTRAPPKRVKSKAT